MERLNSNIINPNNLSLASGECNECGDSSSPPRRLYEIDPKNPRILVRLGSFCDPCLENRFQGRGDDI